MQVQVSIVLENALEFERWTTQQALIADTVRRRDTAETTEAPVAEVVEEAPAPVVETTTITRKKRKRRTKAQMEADAAADATGPSITPQPDPVATEGVKEYTLEDAIPIMRAYIGEHNSPPLVAKLTEAGVERVNEIAPEKLSGFLAELVAETT